MSDDILVELNESDNINVSVETSDEIVIETTEIGYGTINTLDTSTIDLTFSNNALSANFTPTADVSFNSFKITSLADPTLAQDAATKAYVDAQITAEDFWDRSGTTLSPNTAGDSVDIGTGSLTTTNILADGSAGLLLESNNGTDVALLGAGGGSNASFYGGVNVAGQLSAQSTTVSTSPTTGALTVGGGLGVSGAVFGGSLTMPVSSTGLSLYNTADQTTNYELGVMQWSGNNLYLGTIKAGSGTRRALRLTAGDVLGSGNRTELVMDRSTNTRFGMYSSNQGDNSANITVVAIGTVGGFTATSGTTTQLLLAPVHNQSSTAATTDFLINRTETTMGSGAQLFADFQVGGASRLNITNTGNLSTEGLVKAYRSGTPAQYLSITGGTAAGPVIESGGTAKTLTIANTSTAGIYLNTAGFGQALYIANDGSVTALAPTASTSKTTGSLITSGGLGVSTEVYAGGTIFGKDDGNGIPTGMTPAFYRGATAATTVDILGFGSGSRGGKLSGYQDGGGTVQWNFSQLSSGGTTYTPVSISGVASGLTSGGLTINTTTASTSTTTGALTVAGGLGIAGAAFIGNTATVLSAGGAISLDIQGSANYPILKLYRNQTVSAGDFGRLSYFVNPNGGSANTEMARIVAATDGTATTSNIQFQTYDGSSLSSRVTIDNTGLVGIGNTDPQATLHIGPTTATTQSGTDLLIVDTAPKITLVESDQSADSRVWDILADVATLKFRINNDADSVSTTWLQAVRSGTTVSSVTFPSTADVLFSGTNGVHATGGNAGYWFDSSRTLGLANYGSNKVGFRTNNTDNRLVIDSSGLIGIATSAPTHSLTLTSSTTGYAHYNTSDQTTNYERARAYWSSNTFFIGTEKGGSGTSRPMYIDSESAIRIRAKNSSVIYIGNDSAGFVEFGTGSTSSGSNHILANHTFNASSGTQTLLALTPTYNQTSTAATTGIRLNPTFTAVGSGTSRGIWVTHNVGGNDCNGIYSEITTTSGLTGFQSAINGSITNSAAASGIGVTGAHSGTSGRAMWAWSTGNGAEAFRATQDGNGTAVNIGHAGTTAHAISISASSLTTGSALSLGSTSSLSSGTVQYVELAPTISQSLTAGYDILFINPTESSTGSGTKNLVKAQVGNVDKFTVANTGITTITNTTNQADNQVIILQGDRASPTNNDNIYQSWFLSNSAGTQKEIGRMTVKETTVTASSEIGYMSWSIQDSGTLTEKLRFVGSILGPVNNDQLALGTTGTSWSDLFLASGAVIGFNNGDVTITHSADNLTIAGGNLVMTGQTIIATQTPASASATGTTGQIAWDSSYIYICTATNTWKRVAIATW
jgi:hypothetical protein